MQEGDVVACSPFADATRCKAYAVGTEPFHGSRQIIDPQPNMVERRGVDGGFFLDVHGLHDVHFHLHRAFAHDQDVLIHILSLALEGAGLLQPQHIDPELFHAALVGTADGNLLNPQNLEWTRL
ncbi:hypothetical protein D3C72_2135680 [compost metagenome]